MNEINNVRTRQALIAIGGRASRLRADGVSVPISKSFIRVSGRPLLFWCLEFLYIAGIRELILCADDPTQERAADVVLAELPVKFSKVTNFRDPGLGVHCLPYHVREHLHDWCLFECGHNVTLPSHLQAMDRLKSSGNVVFSAFDPHPENLRYPVRLIDGVISRGPRIRAPEQFAFAHPLLIHREIGDREQIPV
jgi:dTDP-glucose pyrophosphorylase